MRKYRNQIIFGMAFMVAVMIAVILLSNARDLAERLGDFPLWLFVPIIGLKVTNWILRYLEWHYFLHIIGVRGMIRGETRPPLAAGEPATIRVQDSFLLWMVSLPFALSPGKIAEVLKALILKNMTGAPVSRSTPIILAERIVDGIAVMGLVIVAALVSGDAIFGADELSVQTMRGVLIFATVFMLGLVLVVQFPRAAHRLIHFVGRVPLIGRFENEIVAFYDSSHDLARLRHIAITVFFGLGAYFSDSVGFYLMLLGLGQEASWELFTQAVFILGFSVIVSALSAMPGGAGGREITVGALLRGIVGMSSASTGAAVLMIGIFQVWFGALVGIVLGLIFRKRLFPASLQREIEAYERREEAASAGVA